MALLGFVQGALTSAHVVNMKHSRPIIRMGMGILMAVSVNWGLFLWVIIRALLFWVYFRAALGSSHAGIML